MALLIIVYCLRSLCIRVVYSNIGSFTYVLLGGKRMKTNLRARTYRYFPMWMIDKDQLRFLPVEQNRNGAIAGIFIYNPVKEYNFISFLSSQIAL